MKLSKVDFFYKDIYVLPGFKIQLSEWYKVKFVHYHDGNDYRFKGTINGKVLLDLTKLGQNKYDNMKLMSHTISLIGNIQKIRIASKCMIFVYVEKFKTFFLELEELESNCFKLTSAEDDLCGDDKSFYKGSTIDILQNGVLISNIAAQFTHFYECFDRQKDDIFEIKAQNGDGVSC